MNSTQTQDIDAPGIYIPPIKTTIAIFKYFFQNFIPILCWFPQLFLMLAALPTTIVLYGRVFEVTGEDLEILQAFSALLLLGLMPFVGVFIQRVFSISTSEPMMMSFWHPIKKIDFTLTGYILTLVFSGFLLVGIVLGAFYFVFQPEVIYLALPGLPLGIFLIYWMYRILLIVPIKAQAPNLTLRETVRISMNITRGHILYMFATFVCAGFFMNLITKVCDKIFLPLGEPAPEVFDASIIAYSSASLLVNFIVVSILLGHIYQILKPRLQAVLCSKGLTPIS